jgi:hypothetical protein
MGLDHSPLIVTDGLVFFIDAGNTRSYSGSGITINGLVSGIGATISGGFGFSASNSGSIYLTRPSLGYIQVPPVSWRSSCLWVRLTDPNVGSYYLIDGRDGIANSWVYSDPLGPPYGTAWSKLYINGIVQTISNSNGIGNTSLYPRNTWLHVYLELSNSGNGDVHIFSRFSNNETSTGNVSQVQIYNRALTASEIVQNYNATKRRYGL